MIKLELIGTPHIDNPVELKVNVASLKDLQQANINVFLPSGFELVEGDLSWNGDLRAVPAGLVRLDDEELAREVLEKGRNPMDVVLFDRLSDVEGVQFAATIKAVKTGDWQIVALPVDERPAAVNCPGIDTSVKFSDEDLWKRYSSGGCLNIRVHPRG